MITRDAARLQAGPGDLHALVRRARPGPRRRHGQPARRTIDSAGRPPSRTCRWIRQQTARARRRRRGRVGARSRRWRCRARRPRACCAPWRDADIDGAEVLPRDERARSPAGRSRSRAPATRAISATKSGWIARTPAPCGTRSSRPARRSGLRPTGLAGARRRAHRGGTAAHRRRFLQRAQGADGVAALHAVRDGPRSPGRSRQGPRSSAARALAAERARGPRRRIVGLAMDWPDVEALYEAVGLPPLAQATASRVAVPVFAGGRQIGRMTSSTWSPVLKQMIGLATIESRLREPGHGRRGRAHGRRRPPPRPRARRPDAVSSIPSGRR